MRKMGGERNKQKRKPTPPGAWGRPLRESSGNRLHFTQDELDVGTCRRRTSQQAAKRKGAAKPGSEGRIQIL